MQEINSDDRYQLRKVQMDVDKKSLEAQKANQDLHRLILELEHKYGLIANGQNIDPRTAEIYGTINNKKGTGKELLESIVFEATGTQ